MAYAEDEPEEEKKTGFWVLTPWGGWTNMAEVPCFRFSKWITRIFKALGICFKGEKYL